MLTIVLLVIAVVLFVVAAIASHVTAGGITGRVHLARAGSLRRSAYRLVMEIVSI